MYSRLLFNSLTLSVAERCTGTKFWSLHQRAMCYEKATDGEQARQQVARIRQLVHHATEQVPLWRERSPSHADQNWSCANEQTYRFFSQLPICTKQDLRMGFPERVTCDGARDQWRLGNSSGTVERITIVSDFNKRDVLRANNLRIVEQLIGHPLGARIVEMPPDACNVICALRDEGPVELIPYVQWAWRKGILFKPECRPDLRGRLERSLIVRQDTVPPLPPKPLSELQPLLDSCLERLSSSRANIVRGLPLFLLWLAERATERRLKFPTLRAVTPYGALTSDSMARRIESGFGVQFRDYYGTSEFGPVAIQSGSAPGLRILHDQVLVEIVDEAGQPVTDGRIGRMLITDLHNFAMPLIRYEVGDYGRWIDGEVTSDGFANCRRCRLEIVGRGADLRPAAAGEIVHTRQVMEILFADPAIKNACLEEIAPGKMRLGLVAPQALAPGTIPRLQSMLQVPGPIQIRKVDFLRPEASGKYRCFKPFVSRDA